MRIEWLVSDMTPVVSPERAERDIFRVIFDIFAQVRPLLWLGKQFEMYEYPLQP